MKNVPISGMHEIWKSPITDAQSGIEVLKVLHACQASIEQNGIPNFNVSVKIIQAQ